MLRWYEQKLHYTMSDLELYSCFHDVRCFTNIFVIVCAHDAQVLSSVHHSRSFTMLVVNIL